MIELPNGKISRTLPEQVGFNSKKNEEIIKWINDSDFIDKVVDLSDPGGTLTNAQYSIVELSPSYIIYGGKVFVKSLEDSDNIDFFKVGTDMSGSTSIVASVERIRVVKSTKVYSYSVVQLFESYNKSQLDAFLSGKADLSGATFDGPVVAQTLKQNQANWSVDITSFPNITGGTASPIFCRIQQINQELHVVMLGKIENNTESDISAYSTNLLQITLPEEIAEKIYDVNGNKASQAALTNSRISYNYASASRSEGSDMSKYLNDVCMAIINTNTSNIIGIMFQRNTSITIPAGETMYFESRVSLDLI